MVWGASEMEAEVCGEVCDWCVCLCAMNHGGRK